MTWGLKLQLCAAGRGLAVCHHSEVTKRVFPWPCCHSQRADRAHGEFLSFPGTMSGPSEAAGASGSHGAEVTGRACSRIPCSQSSTEKAVDTFFSPPTAPTSPAPPLPPAPLATQELREGRGEEGSFLEGRLHHLSELFQKQTPSGELEEAGRRVPILFPGR